MCQKCGHGNTTPVGSGSGGGAADESVQQEIHPASATEKCRGSGVDALISVGRFGSAGHSTGVRRDLPIGGIVRVVDALLRRGRFPILRGSFFWCADMESRQGLGPIIFVFTDEFRYP